MTGGFSSGHSGLSGWEIDTPMTTDGPDAFAVAADLFAGLAAAFGAGLAIFASVALTGFSASTSSAGLSARSPLKAAWRTLPSPVKPANSISATSSGRAQCMLLSLGGLAPAAKGLVLLSTVTQARHQLARGGLAETGADPADIDQLLAARLVIAIHASQQ